MRLLVSVVDAAEARTAAAGGADIVDVKDPAEGSLGAPLPATVTAVRARVPAEVPVSVALGDLPHLPGTAALAAAGAAAAGARYVKAGLRGSGTPGQATALLRAVREALADHPGTLVVGCAYADAARITGTPLPPLALPAAAAAAGIAGCLLDTAVKDGRGLFEHTGEEVLAAFVAEAHAAGLEVALAGALRAADLPRVAALGADVAGVRSAACRDGVRTGALDAERVAELVALARA